jgi:hypothetical protein
MPFLKLGLVLLAVGVLFVLFRHRQRVEMRAGSKMLAVVLGALAIASIIDPLIPQRVALALGLSRGTDLLLYALIVVFMLTTLGLYFRLRDTDNRLRQVARALAIDMALREGEPDEGVVDEPVRPPA